MKNAVFTDFRCRVRFPPPPIHKCLFHKHLRIGKPDYGNYFGNSAYGMKDFDQAKTQLEKTAEWLEGINPSAAAPLREGLEETLTLHRLGIPDLLRKSLQSTNLIESALSVATEVADNVKRWRAGDMRLRWIAAGLLAAEKQFRRVRGHKLMPKLTAALGVGAAEIAGGSKAA